MCCILLSHNLVTLFFLLVKAAIARCGSSTFHILAPEPDECSNFPHAVLLYECGQNGPGDCKQMARTSGEGSAVLPLERNSFC
jgi:hypothetical protein